MPRLMFLVSDAAFFLSHRLPIAHEALKAGYEVAIACPPSGPAAQFGDMGFQYLTIRMRRKGSTPLSELQSVISIFWVIRKFNPDLIHQITAKPVIYGGVISRIVGIPTVSAISGLGYIFVSEAKHVKLLRKLIVVGYRAAVNNSRNHVIFQNEDDLNVFRNFGILNCVNHTMIPGSGVDLEKITPAPLPPGKTVLVLPARLLRDKGVVEFVEAARILKIRGVQAVFRLLGDPDEGNPTSISREQLNRWNSEGIIEWHPFTDDIGSALAQSHIVVLPSYREGFPKTIIDAAAAGRVSAVSNVPGCRDAIVPGKTGVLYNARDAENTADVLESLIKSRELQKMMGKAARRHAEKKFDVRDVCARHLEIYSSLIN